MAHRTPPVNLPARSDLIDALAFVQSAKKWLEDHEEATAAGFDPMGSAVLMLDRAEEFLTAAVAD